MQILIEILIIVINLKVLGVDMFSYFINMKVFSKQYTNI